MQFLVFVKGVKKSKMSKGVYLYIFILLLAGVFGIFIGFFKIPKGTIKVDNEIAEEQKAKIERTGKHIYIMIKLIQYIIVICALWYILIPFILDLPYLFENRYKSITGNVTSVSSDFRRSREVKVQDEKTGEIISVQVFGGDIMEYQDITVIYYPHLKIGTKVK